VLAVEAQSSVTLSWNQSTNLVAGYYVYQGTSPRTYNVKLDAGKNLQRQMNGLAAGTTYFFAVSAYNSAGMESAFSTEASYTTSSGALPPGVPSLTLQVLPNKQVVLSGIGQGSHAYDVLATTDLKTWTTIASITSDAAGNISFTDTAAPTLPVRFYRLRG
jgi:hypothetical protein